MRCRPTVVRSSPSASTSSIYGYARCGGAVKKIVPRGKGSGGWQTTSFPNRVSFISGPVSASPSDTRGGSRMPELGPYGSVRGALSNERPYRDLAKTRPNLRQRLRLPAPSFRQSAPVELAALGLRQGGAEHDLLRRLEGRQPITAIAQQLIDRRARPRHHIAHDLLAVDRVRHADGGDLDHLG